MIIRMKDTRLSEESMKAAETLASNEINEIMADLEIMQDQLDQTYLFQGMNLKEYAIQHLKQIPRNKDCSSFSDEVLAGIHRYYFGDLAKGNS